MTHQRVHILAIAGIDGDADARRDDDGVQPKLDGLLQILDQPRGHRRHLIGGVDIGQQHDEFVAAEPEYMARQTRASRTVGAHHIARPQRPQQA